ncbi:hypothetical protein [Stratiformator vulcanicus]|uniref:Uncharacterized protein n=1 Tax=Stratiformator vulcanicus TaxID=2527980 RepID=A0A517R1Z7_9PLAN|nr:hypothetical protein [Stratiformator vulcanicus]QDT37900.1 hypothetical protein Pan189_22830 [Stratiformator vulcanicus]
MRGMICLAMLGCAFALGDTASAGGYYEQVNYGYSGCGSYPVAHYGGYNNCGAYGDCYGYTSYDCCKKECFLKKCWNKLCELERKKNNCLFGWLKKDKCCGYYDCHEPVCCAVEVSCSAPVTCSAPTCAVPTCCAPTCAVPSCEPTCAVPTCCAPTCAVPHSKW